MKPNIAGSLQCAKSPSPCSLSLFRSWQRSSLCCLGGKSQHSSPSDHGSRCHINNIHPICWMAVEPFRAGLTAHQLILNVNTP